MMGCSPTKASRAPVKPASNHHPVAHLLQAHDLRSAIHCVAISEDRSLLVAGDEKGCVSMWSTRSTPTECLGELFGHQGAVTCCEIYGNYIFSGSADCTIIKWSISGTEKLYVYTGHTFKINRLFCAGNFLFSTSYDRTAKAWYIDSDGSSTALSRVSGGLAEEDDAIENEALVCTFRGHQKSVYPIAFIPGDNNLLMARHVCERDMLITGSADCTARIWSFATSECRKVLRGHCAPIHCLAVDPATAKQVFTAGGDGMIISWDVITGDQLRRLSGHQGTVLCLHVHNKMLFSGGADKTARAWVVEFGEETRVFRGSHAPVTCVQHYDGMRSADGTSRIYDAKSGALKRTFKGTVSSIVALQNVPGRVFTASLDGMLNVWDTEGFREETVFGKKAEEEDDESDEDCEKVQHAIKVLSTYIRP